MLSFHVVKIMAGTIYIVSNFHYSFAYKMEFMLQVRRRNGTDAQTRKQRLRVSL